MNKLHVSISFRSIIKVFLLFVVLVFCSSLFAAPPPGDWTLVWQDEFNSSTLDTDKWVDKYLEYRTQEHRAEARYSFRNGKLVLRIDADQPTYYVFGSGMRVSSIQTGQRDYLHKDNFDHHTETDVKFAPTSGYIEVRAKTTVGSGMHTAFWSTGDRKLAWQECEIDVFETQGRSTAETNLNLFRWDDYSLTDDRSTVPLGFDSSQDFHIYGLEWDSTSFNIYIDGILKKSFNQGIQYGSIFYLSIYEGAEWTGLVDPSIPYPKEMEVDYIRYYAQEPAKAIYQAEVATRYLNVECKTEHSGYTDLGYMDFGGQDSFIEWSFVKRYAAGNAGLDFRYANGSTDNRQCRVTVNDTHNVVLDFPSTGAWTSWATLSVDVPVNAGYNNIQVKAITNRGGPNIDCLNINDGTVFLSGLYTIKNKHYNKYLDSDPFGVCILENGTIYDDQKWKFSVNTDGYYHIENRRPGRKYLYSDTSGFVRWNDGLDTGADTLWEVKELGTNTYTIRNVWTGREYMYGTAQNEVKWNTGSTNDPIEWEIIPTN